MSQAMRAPCTHLQATQPAATTTGTSGVAQWGLRVSFPHLKHKSVQAVTLCTTCLTMVAQYQSLSYR